jgi:aspartate/methionine/tyrosine aminotransferase
MPILRKALADTNPHLLGRPLDPESEISIHSGATEALLSTVTAFVEPGEEVILLEPVFSA